MALRILYKEKDQEKTLQIRREGNKFFYGEVGTGKENEIAKPDIWPMVMELRRSREVISMTGGYL